MKIHFLGTGSAYPGKDRDHTSLCVESEEKIVLIDVSGNPCKKIKQLNMGLDKLDVVILTHFHIDHVYGLPSLLWGMWLENRKGPLYIYCDQTYKEKLRGWFETIGIDEWGIAFSINVHTFDGSKLEEIINTNKMNITCFPAIHSVPTIGLRIKYNNKTIIYSCDTEINSFIQQNDQIDILIHEATFAEKQQPHHSSVKEIVEAYHFSKINKLIFVHLTDNEPYKQVLARFPDAVRNKCWLAEDMETCEVIAE